jgi:hypothetical protein
MAIPNRRSAAIITCVSSLSNAPLSVDVPSASAAQTRARLVMLFEPGGRTVPCTGPLTAEISTLSALNCPILSER